MATGHFGTLTRKVLPFRKPCYIYTLIEKLRNEGVNRPADLLLVSKETLETKLTTHASLGLIEMADILSLRSAIDPCDEANWQQRNSQEKPRRALRSDTSKIDVRLSAWGKLRAVSTPLMEAKPKPKPSTRQQRKFQEKPRRNLRPDTSQHEQDRRGSFSKIDVRRSAWGKLRAASTPLMEAKPKPKPKPSTRQQRKFQEMSRSAASTPPGRTAKAKAQNQEHSWWNQF